MFFLIGGVQPKTLSLDETPRICPACGLAQAALKRVDQYLSLFFIPIFPVKRGVPVLICNRCRAVSSPDQSSTAAAPRIVGPRCLRCGYPVDADFRFCPGCGGRI